MKRAFKTTVDQLKKFSFIGGKKVLAFIATICISLSLNASTRLTLTIAVSSNTYLEENQMRDITNVLLPSVQNCSEISPNTSQYKSSTASAFLGYKGDVIICSASPGQCSWAAQTPFGIMDEFTYVFISSYEGKMFDKDFSWLDFLKDISVNTSELAKSSTYGEMQVPIYDCNLLPTRMPEIIVNH